MSLECSQDNTKTNDRVPRGAQVIGFFSSIYEYFFLEASKLHRNITLMCDDEAAEAMNPDEARDMGTKRFDSMPLFDSPVYIHPTSTWTTDVRQMARHQMGDSINLENLLCAYIELLSRAKAVAEFWEYNVGPTVDWPVSVVGDSPEVEACLLRRMEKLRSVVSFVEESGCS